jgi:hypothetical protein
MDSKQVIFEDLKKILSGFSPPLVERRDEYTDYHLYGTKPVQVGKGGYEGIPFASITIRKAHITLGFFPIYTHPDKFKGIDPALLKLLKGKNCFHVKPGHEDLYPSIMTALELGMKVYKKEGWL